MSKDRIRELLAQLQDEIRNTDMDDELKTLVSDLDSDIHAVIENDEEVNALIDRDRKSTRLNSSHPSLSRMPSSA